jgi:hypothetical protein
MLDLLPVLRNLPDFLLPIKKEGKEIHHKEKELFRNYFFTAKKGLHDGTAKVRIQRNIYQPTSH